MAAPQAGLLPPLSDEILIDRIRAGDRSAFDALYERYLPRVYNFVARRLGNRADTEETVQDVFVNVFSSLDGFRGEAHFSAWIFGVARLTIAGRFKRKRHETVPLEQSDSESSPLQVVSAEPNPLESYECNERLERLDYAARRELSEEQRLLFQLHHLEDRSIQEIAHSTARSVDSVKSHLYRARKVLLAR